VVRTATGLVSGMYENGTYAFLGIPYADAPFGSRRLRPPAPALAWTGVRPCLLFGPTVPKNPYRSPFDRLLPEPAIPGEDCLNLNVWTPDVGSAGLPVVVWIHGGAFENGSAAVPQYCGANFARDGVVCVTVNYRLGAEGFLLLDDGVPNLGLLDQVAALQWVRDNIASFGGDPDRVTIAGESAGAMSVVALLTMPRADALFGAAIAQSGAGHHATTSTTATLIARHLAELVGVPATREAIASVPMPRLLAAQQQVVDDVRAAPDPTRWREVALNQMPFEPIIDGDVLPALPIERLATGVSAQVKVLTGSNSDENRFFLVPTGATTVISEPMLDLMAAGYGLPTAELAAYRAADPDAGPGDLFAALCTDWYFRLPALRLGEVRDSARTWMYEFTWNSQALGGRLGACHALEIPFVFDTLDTDGGDWLTGAGAPQALADEMHRAWVRFITDGDPGWPAYTTDRRSTMMFGEPSRLIDDPRPDTRTVWAERR
jgi:para-nitrobenzyl esterase